MIKETRKTNIVLLILFFLFFFCWWVFFNYIFGFHNEQRTLLWGASYQILAIVGSFFGVCATRSPDLNRSLRTFVSLLTLGLFLQVFGQTSFSFYIHSFFKEIPYPSVSDFGYLGSAFVYLIAAVALVISFRSYKTPIFYLWLFILTLGVVKVDLFFLNMTNFKAGFDMHSIIDLLYVFSQSTTVVLLLAVIFSTHFFKNQATKWALLTCCLGLVMQFLADFYFINVSRIGLWANGGFGDLLYSSAYFILGLGLAIFVVESVAMELLLVVLNSFIFINFFLSYNSETFVPNTAILILSIVVSIILLKDEKLRKIEKEKTIRFEALEESNRKLQQLDQQKTEFLNIAAHQLRTPASIINNYVAMLQDGDFGEVNDEVKKVHAHIGESNQWLVRLADEFLNIAHLEQGETKYHFAQANVSTIINQVVQELKTKAAHKPLEIVWKQGEEPLTVRCDEEKIRHVALNILDNAIKYSEHGVITIQAVGDNEGVEVSVFDQGIGFTREDAKLFFEKFQRGAAAKQIEVNTSTGLGLYICRKFVEGHKGRVWAKSAGPGQGSEFGFWIPKIVQ